MGSFRTEIQKRDKKKAHLDSGQIHRTLDLLLVIGKRDFTDGGVERPRVFLVLLAEKVLHKVETVLHGLV